MNKKIDFKKANGDRTPKDAGTYYEPEVDEERRINQHIERGRAEYYNDWFRYIRDFEPDYFF